MLIQDPLFWGLALIGLLIVGVSKGGFGCGWRSVPCSRNPGQSSSSHDVALPNHHGYYWIVRLAWSVVLDSVKATIAGSGPWCLPRGIGLSCIIG